MAGIIALVGSGEFTPEMVETDRLLLSRIDRARPLVAVVPTASWPDGPEVFARWATMGAEHFGALGCDVEQLLLRDREGAGDPALLDVLARADLVYLSGGKPNHLLDALDGTPAGAAVMAAHERGAVVAGCSAGAMVLAGFQVEAGPRGFFRLPVRWRPALGLVPRTAVVPHYDAFPEPLSAGIAMAAPEGVRVLGIDEATALVGRDAEWQVTGRGRVTVWTGRERHRHRAGATITL